MSDRDGTQTLVALRKFNDGVCALLSTGFGLEGRLPEATAAGFAGWVQKPFHPYELSLAVAHALKTAQLHSHTIRSFAESATGSMSVRPCARAGIVLSVCCATADVPAIAAIDRPLRCAGQKHEGEGQLDTRKRRPRASTLEPVTDDGSLPAGDHGEAYTAIREGLWRDEPARACL
jgi:hypothetical protein